MASMDSGSPDKDKKPKRPPVLSTETRGLLIIAALLFVLYLLRYLRLAHWRWTW
jgi:hypothetical protein